MYRLNNSGFTNNRFWVYVGNIHFWVPWTQKSFSVNVCIPMGNSSISKKTSYSLLNSHQSFILSQSIRTRSNLKTVSSALNTKKISSFIIEREIGYNGFITCVSKIALGVLFELVYSWLLNPFSRNLVLISFIRIHSTFVRKL